MLSFGRDHEYVTDVNGLHRFGLNKLGLARAVVKFRRPPSCEGYPLTLCFQFPSAFLTHRYVLDMVRNKLQKVEEQTGRVTSIQYVDRNVIHGTRGLDHRWLVTLSSAEARDELLKRGLHLYSRRVALRPYADILREEYREFTQYGELQSQLFHVSQGLQGRSKTLSSAAARRPVRDDISVKAKPESADPSKRSSRPSAGKIRQKLLTDTAQEPILIPSATDGASVNNYN